MRTTLDIDDDVLLAVKERAALEGSTLGKTVSALVRQSLHAPLTAARTGAVNDGVDALRAMGFGILPLPPGSRPVTNELVNRLRDEEGI